MKIRITLAVLAGTLFAGDILADDKAQPTNTIIRTAMLFPVSIDTKKSIPVSIVSADAPILNAVTTNSTLVLKFTNEVLNITIASPGYEAKTMRLVGSEKMSIVGMIPEKKKAPTRP